MDLREYYQSLTEREKQDFISVLDDMVQEGSDVSLQGLRQTIRQLRLEIDKVYTKRKQVEETLVVQRKTVETLCLRVGNGPEKGDNATLRLLEGLMDARARHLHNRIGEMSPSAKVSRKSLLVQQLESLEQRRRSALAIQKMILELEATSQVPSISGETVSS